MVPRQYTKEATRDIMSPYRGTGQKRYIFSDNKIYCTRDDYYQVLFDKYGSRGRSGVSRSHQRIRRKKCTRRCADAEKVLVWSPVIELEPGLQEIARTFREI